jgi:hypothetical protein
MSIGALLLTEAVQKILSGSNTTHPVTEYCATPLREGNWDLNDLCYSSILEGIDKCLIIIIVAIHKHCNYIKGSDYEQKG